MFHYFCNSHLSLCIRKVNEQFYILYVKIWKMLVVGWKVGTLSLPQT